MARADAGLTISELAKRAGVSRDTISNAERGYHSLQASTLHKVARALGRTPSELLAEEERLAPKAQSSSLEPTLNDVLEDLWRATTAFDEYHTAARAMDEFTEVWEKRLAEEDFDEAAFKEAGLTLKAFWPSVVAAADSEMGELARRGLQPEEAATESSLLPAIARFQALGERVNSAYREKLQNTSAALYELFPQRKAS